MRRETLPIEGSITMGTSSGGDSGPRHHLLVSYQSRRRRVLLIHEEGRIPLFVRAVRNMAHSSPFPRAFFISLGGEQSFSFLQGSP